MANEQNLIPLNKRTQRERKEICTKGAIASNKAQKKKKSMQELAKIIAASPVSNDRQKRKLKEKGIADEDMTNDALVTAALLDQALKGDVKAIEKWQELTSEESDNKIEALKELLGSIGKIE
jgi:hypothetical protein